MIVLAELTPLNPTTGLRETLRASSANDSKINGLNDVIWQPAISTPPILGIRLFKGDFDGSIAPNGGSLTIQIDRYMRTFPAARGFIWQGARIKLWAGQSGQAWPWTQVFEGIVDGDSFTAQGNKVSLNVKSDISPFEKDVLTLKYLGTGGIEGGDGLKGQVKPFLLGRCSNVEPVLIDAVNNVYQFSGYGPIQAVNALYERGAAFPASTGNYATYAALVAATIPNGGWGTCLASGLIRLGAPQYGVITGDVDGDAFGGTWRRKTGEIVQRIASNAGISGSLVDSTSWNALDTALSSLTNQGRIGYFIDSQRSVLDVAAQLAAPCNAQAGVSLLGKLFACRMVIGAGSLTLDAQQRRSPRVTSSEETGVSSPFSYIQFGYDRAWRVHTADEIAFVDPATSGGTGPAGLSNATVFAFKRSATAPTNPSATATYTFATGLLSGLNNGWTQSVPASDGNPLYVIAATASSNTATDTIAAGEWSTAVIQSQDGGSGTNGLSTASVYLYQRNDTGTAPAVPTASLTYTFATALLSGGSLAGWTQTVPPASGGKYIFITTATALSTGATDTITTSEWATVQILAQDGANGPAGLNNATVFAFRRSATVPTNPSATGTYTFTTGALTGLNNGWTQAVPTSDGNPLYVIAATASSTGTSDTIAGAEWSSPVIQAQDGSGGTGSNGLNTASIYLYQRNNTGTAPSVPSATLTYTFTTALLSGGSLSGWAQTVPAASGGMYLFVTTAAALSASATDTIASSEWATVQILAQDGTNGVSAFTLVNVANTEIATANSIKKISGGSGIFDAKARTLQGHIAASVSITAGFGATGKVFGLTNDPDVDASSNSIDYAFSFNAPTGGLAIIRNGALELSGLAATNSDRLTITTDATLVRYFKNAALLHSHAVNSSTETLFGAFSLSSINDTFSEISFSPAGEAGSDGIDALDLAAVPNFVPVLTNAIGAVNSGQLPRTITFTAREGNADVTSSTTFALLGTLDGCAASQTSGPTFSLDTIAADQGGFEVMATRGAKSTKRKVTFAKAKEGAAAQRSEIGPLGTPTTSYNPASGVLSLNIVSGVTVTMSMSADYDATGTGTARIDARLMYRNITDGGAWTQAGSTLTGSNASNTGGSEPVLTPGSVGGSSNVTAPSSTKVYEFRVEWIRVGVTVFVASSAMQVQIT